MKSRSGRIALALVAVAVAAGALAACNAERPPAQPPADADPRVLGFVFTQFRQTMTPPNEVTCPEGFNLNTTELGEKLGEEPTNDCGDPAAHEVPRLFTLEGPGPIVGLDLDATSSTRAAEGACAHDEYCGKHDGQPYAGEPRPCAVGPSTSGA